MTEEQAIEIAAKEYAKQNPGRKKYLVVQAFEGYSGYVQVEMSGEERQ